MDNRERILDVPFEFSPKILLVLFGLALFTSFVMGIIYLYHWRKYSVRGRDIIWAEIIYLIGAMSLLVVIFLTAFLYIYG